MSKKIMIPGFQYSNIFTKISEPDFEIQDGDKFVFDWHRYCYNILIGVRGECCGPYARQAKREHEEKFGEIFTFNYEEVKDKPQDYKQELYKFLQRYAKKYV